MNDIVKVIDGKIEIVNEVVEQIKAFQKTKLQMDLMEKELKEKLKEVMEKNDIKQFAFNGIYAEIKHVNGRTSIDSKRLKEELPDIYEEYSKVGKPYSSFTFEVTE